VQVPVVPDTEGFQLLIDDAVAEAKATVTVPVVPDAAGFPEAVDAAVAEDDKSVTIPVVPDMAGFEETADAEAATAGAEAGATFSERLAAAVEASGLTAVWPELYTGAGPAGAEAGGAFGEEFAVAAEPRLSALLGASSAGLVTEAGTAGEEAGTVFLRGFTAATAGMEAPLAALAPAAEAEGAVAGEAGGVSFAERFSAALAGVGGTLDKTFTGMAAEGSAAGAETGEGFVASMKTVLMGGMSPMEALMGAGFVAATAVMASKFQAAMELIHTQAQVPQSAIAGLSGQVLALAGNVGESPSGLATALYHVESSFQSTGITGQKAMQLVQIAAEGARTGGADLVDVTNALDATMVSAVGGIKNASQAMGALNAIVGAGDMTMQNLADAMGTGLMAQAKLYGQSITQVGAALATLGDNNIKGAKAATDLRMTWQAMEVPLSTAGAALQHLGLTSTQLGNVMTHQGLTAAIGVFVQHLKASKVPVGDWGQYVTEIFGKKAGTGIGVLVDQYGRLQSKLGDVAKGAGGFASAWAATQQTTSQKLKDLESSFESLMIKIGSALLPVLNKLMGDVNSALPGLEKFAGSLVHLVAPVVSVFFQGLGGIVKEFVGFLSSNAGSLEKFGAGLVKLALPVVHTFFTNLLSIIGELVRDIEGWLPHFEKLGETIARIAVPAVGLFFTGLGAILKVLLGPLKDVTLAVGLFALAWAGLNAILAINPFVAIGVGLVILTGLIIKYHKQILDAIEDAWNHVYSFVSGIAAQLVSLFENWTLPGLIIKYHQEIWSTVQQVWHEIVSFIETIVGGASTWLSSAWNGIWSTIKTVWNQISSWFTTWWTTEVKGWEKIVTTLEAWFKTAWNQVWTDIKTVWNDISSWFTTWWNNEIRGWENIVTDVEGWLKNAWNTIKSDAVEGFDEVRSAIASVWDGIVSDAENFINEIVSKIQGIGKSIVSLPGKLLGDIGLAGGGVLPGYAPGHDTISAKLSPGEAVLVPEAVRAIGPGTINAINAHYRAGRGGGGDGYALGGLVPGYSAGGISPYAAGQAAGSAYGLAATGAEQLTASGAPVININFYGPQYPSPEMEAAIMMKVSAAIGVS